MTANFERFMAVYERHLREAADQYPEEYGWARAPGFPEPDPAGVILARMRGAFLRGTYNKDGRAIRAACRELKIPHTYKGINAFLREEAA